MSTHIIGIKPPDEKWTQMKAVYDACKAAGIDPPDEVEKFFNHEPPDAAGVKVELDPGYSNAEKERASKLGVEEYVKDGYSGFQVDLTKLPKDVTIVGEEKHEVQQGRHHEACLIR